MLVHPIITDDQEGKHLYEDCHHQNSSFIGPGLGLPPYHEPGAHEQNHWHYIAGNNEVRVHEEHRHDVIKHWVQVLHGNQGLLVHVLRLTD